MMKTIDANEELENWRIGNWRANKERPWRAQFAQVKGKNIQKKEKK